MHPSHNFSSAETRVKGSETAFLAKIAMLLFFTVPAFGQLPEAPQPMRMQRQTIENRREIIDKKFIAAHSIYFSSLVFDIESTHMGLARHRCHEGTFGGGRDPYPSRGEMYRNFMGWFALFTTADYLVSTTRLPKWLPLQYAAPTFETTIHVKGALTWYEGCW